MYYLLNHNLEVLAQSEIPSFSIEGYMTVRADSVAQLPIPRKRKLPVSIELPKIEKGDWNFNLLDEKEKVSLLEYFKEKDWDRIKALLNSKKVAVLCCTTHETLITKQINTAKENGQL